MLGPIDILVHNAGGDIAAAGGKPDPNDAVGICEEDVRAVLDRNLLSTILTCQVWAPCDMTGVLQFVAVPALFVTPSNTRS